MKKDTVQSASKKKFRWRRPRHTLKGRQIACEVERVGLRLHLLNQQAEAGDIVLLYGDECVALTPFSDLPNRRTRARFEPRARSVTVVTRGYGDRIGVPTS